MLKFKIVYLLIFSILFNQNLYGFFGPPSSSFLKSFESSTSTANTFSRICYDNQIPFKSISRQWSSVCEVVKRSELCKSVKSKSDLIDCENAADEKVNVTSWNFLYNCGSGLWKSLKELMSFLRDAIFWMVSSALESDLRESRQNKLGEYHESIVNYMSIEFEKAVEDTGSETDAAVILFGGVLSKIFEAINKVVSTEFYSLGCYNTEAGAERLCKIFADLFAPPALALGVLVKGTKLAKQSPKLSLLFKKHKIRNFIKK